MPQLLLGINDMNEQLWSWNCIFTFSLICKNFRNDAQRKKSILEVLVSKILPIIVPIPLIPSYNQIVNLHEILKVRFRFFLFDSQTDFLTPDF